ncbi:MAG: hypothetical protein O6952_04435, partial [Planctomycetota bacterium]|nr:hypothetical protein [Planctomycetota bacterium]
DEMESYRPRGNPVFEDAARLLQFILPPERKLDMRYAGLGLLLLIGYVMAIGPVDYIRLRRKSRLKRGWVSFSVYTLACSAFFLLWGSLFSPASTTLRQVVFADEGIVQTFSMLQGGKSAEFKIEGEGAISALDSMWLGWGESPSEGWTVEPPSRLTLPVAILSRRLISSCRSTKDGEIGIEARWEAPAEEAVLLKNRGLLDLDPCYLLKDDRVYSIGSLPHDSRKSVKLGEAPSRTLRDWINSFTQDEPGFSATWVGNRQVSLGPEGWLFALSFYDKWCQQAGYRRIPNVIRQRKLDMSATFDRGAAILVGLFRQDLSGVRVDGNVKQETLGIVRIPVETKR